MPSTARLNFERHLLRDVQQLKGLHREQFQGPGRPQSFLTRSGIFMLCAAWELYCEDVIKQSSDIIIGEAEEPNNLPRSVKKILALEVRKEKNELASLRLAGDGWRIYLKNIVEKKLSSLNTPSCEKLIILFNELVGIDVGPTLNPHNDQLAEFISKRGEIAHRGADAGHVSINDLEADYDYICHLVVELDNFIIDPIKTACGKRPWNHRKFTPLDT